MPPLNLKPRFITTPAKRPAKNPKIPYKIGITITANIPIQPIISPCSPLRGARSDIIPIIKPAINPKTAKIRP